jgi:hypothetical protein
MQHYRVFDIDESETGIKAPKASQAYNLGKPPGSTRRGQQPQSPDSPSLTRYKTSNDHNKDIFIPLEAYACGSHIVESVDSDEPNPRYWLRVRDARVSILHSPIENNHEIVNLELRRDICNVRVSRDQNLIFSCVLSDHQRVLSVPARSRRRGHGEFPAYSIYCVINEHYHCFLRTHNELWYDCLVCLLFVINHISQSPSKRRSS